MLLEGTVIDISIVWDSADIYQDSEDLVGKWFARTGKRNEIFLATKFAARVVGEGEQMRRIVDSTPEYCKQACEKSLKRLGVEQIDLYYCHRVDQKTPIEKTIEAMVELKKLVSLLSAKWQPCLYMHFQELSWRRTRQPGWC